MTLPTSGPISIGMVAAELGISLPLSLGDPRVRALAGKPSGPISLGDLRGKSAVPPFSLTAKNDWQSADSRFGPGTVSCSPGVTRVGGTGTVSYSWVVLSNPSGANVVLGTGPSVTVSATYRQNENGFANVQLRCTGIDESGQQRTVDVSGSLEWGGSL